MALRLLDAEECFICILFCERLCCVTVILTYVLTIKLHSWKKQCASNILVLFMHILVLFTVILTYVLTIKLLSCKKQCASNILVLFMHAC